LKYLFFDIECANCFGGKGKICSFGYCIIDENFNEIERRDIVINPKSKFHLGPANDAVIQLAYSKEDFSKAPDFSFYYEEIKELLTRDGQIVFGHAVNNDLSFIRSDCQRYDKPLFYIKSFDTQAFYRQISEEGNDVGLEKLCERYSIEKEHLHRSDYDALITMKAMKGMCKEKGLTISEMIEAHPNAYVELKGNEIIKNFNPPTNAKILLDYSKRIHVDRKVMIKDLCAKTIGLDDSIENDNMKLAKALVYSLKRRGAQFSIRARRLNYYVQEKEGSEKSKKVNALRENGVNIEVISLDGILALLNMTKDELNQLIK